MIPEFDNRPWWQRYWGMPTESVPTMDGYCMYCHWQGTVSVQHVHAVLCPKCDMPLSLKEPTLEEPNERSELMQSDAVASQTDCGVAHPTKFDTNCTRAKNHGGFHTDFKKMYSWPSSDADTKTWCGRELRAGSYCTRPWGHVGICYASAHLAEEIAKTATETIITEHHAPTIQLTQKAGAGMITARLGDGTIVAIEFHHEYKTIAGRKHTEPTRGIAYRNKSKVLAGTEAKLYRLEERTDDDKPGVTTLVKALLVSTRVTPHVKDRARGLAGGRRAALKRLLCEHTLDTATGTCAKCHLRQKEPVLVVEPLGRDDRRLVWDAYWDATASVRGLKCGCLVKMTVSRRLYLTPCEKCAVEATV